MESRCLYCPRPAVKGRSRCSYHGPTSPRGPNPYGAKHQALARKILSRSSVCAICGEPPTPEDPLQADHIIPRSLGGRTVESNYQAVHRSCNIRKGGANRL